MSNNIEAAIDAIRSAADRICENQMYCWPGFDPERDDPDEFFGREGIEFDGDLFIRYPVKRTFNPFSKTAIQAQEKKIGTTLPSDYKRLLEEFGGVHLPGDADVYLWSPEKAHEVSRELWCDESAPLTLLAFSHYHHASDGNMIGFLRRGDAFDPAVYELDHELRWNGKDPSTWIKKRADSLADFIVKYLTRKK